MARKAEILIDSKYEGHTFEVDLGKSMRCPYCERLLFKGKLGKNTAIEIKCKGCKRFIRIKSD